MTWKAAGPARGLLWSTLLVATVAWAGPAASPAALAPVSNAQIWYTDQFVLSSKIVGRDFLIQVAKPMLPKPGKAPAVYLLDGNEMFGAVAAFESIAGLMHETAPAYVIGIGYPSQDMRDWTTERWLDLTHVTPPPPDKGYELPSGGGARFQRFLTEELRPLIESRYPVDPARAILAGHSLGGLFAAHVLLNDPKAFGAYLIGSPSLWAEPGLLTQASTFKTSRRIPVFIGVGGKGAKSMIDATTSLATRLTDHPSGLDVAFWIVPGETHITMQPAFYARAMQFALPPPPVPPSLPPGTVPPFP